IMSSLLAKEKNHEWEIPEGLVRITICPLTGSLPCEGCGGKSEWFLEDSAPNNYCSPEAIEKIKEQKEKEGQILEPAASIESTPPPRRFEIRLGP
ncbi:MAG: hypothetical protein AAB875_06445, partial [Patescibacteria group bacterium]